MTELNDFLFGASLPSQFATALLFRIGPAGIEYSNAAHPPFIVLHRATRKAELIEMPSNLLGATPHMTYDNNRLEVEAGDLIFTYTDGLTDRRNAQGEFYAIERIAAVLEREGESDFSTIYDAVYEEVTSFMASDDLKDDIAFILTRIK
jgi:sigma-B regulation protein RsbU (phosphoserine phosphatase)